MSRGPVDTTLDAIRFVVGLALGALMSLLWSLIALPLVWILPEKLGRSVGRGVARNSFRAYLKALALIGAYRIDMAALDAVGAAGPMVIAPNHPSLLDAIIALSRIPNLACVMKAEIADNLFLGAGARLCRYIRNDTSRGMIHAAVAELKAGRHLLLFPEGTRTNRPPVGPIRGGIGVIAKRAQTPIQAVLIWTDSEFLGKSWPFSRIPRTPIHVRVELGKRFDPPTDAHMFAADLEEYFGPALGQLAEKTRPSPR
ncbi:MAG TPA: lysophospholipid acyltransferase family protein [Acidiferrobacter sp.]|nr:lysophospholipid acyltransferase family protein [Acidiferrobacter sp.]